MPVWVLAVGRLRGQAKHEPGNRVVREVGQRVDRVRQHGQRARREAHDELEGENGGVGEALQEEDPADLEVARPAPGRPDQEPSPDYS